MEQKDYTGVRTEVGCVVKVNGKPLDPRNDLSNHSPTGFEWGYEGSGPAQLALALLADYTGKDDVAMRFHQQFKRDAIAPLDGDWTMTGEFIQTWLDTYRK